MGLHAFAATPSQAVRLRSFHPEFANTGLYGVAAGWDAPVTLWRAANGFDIAYPCNEHNTLSFVVGGASVQRLDGRFAGRLGYADSDSFMLYTDGGSRRYASRGDTRLCQIYFHAALVQDLADLELDDASAGLELRDDRIFARDHELRALLDQYVRRAADTVAPPSRLEMDARAVLIGVHLIRNHSNRSRPFRPTKGSLSPRRLATVIDYIEEHVSEPLSIRALAASVGLSQSHFCSAFRHATGMSPHRYVTLRRVERAKRLLSGSAPLSEIALQCGFASQQHFTTAFRKVLGNTPGAVRAADQS